MRIKRKGVAHQHNRINAKCNFCETVVQFWQGEPGTVVEHTGWNKESWNVKWTCPVCDQENYEAYLTYGDDEEEKGLGVEKDHIMSIEEKEEMMEALKPISKE